MFTIETRDVPAQTVLTEQRVVLASELQAFIDDSMGRQMALAETLGGVVGPAFFIYHAEVTNEQAGPVEICLPVDAEHAAGSDAPIRIETGHREAFTRIPKRLVAFPEILTAYDAVEAWIRETGATMTGSPREVYFADFMAAGDDDDACDIAFPIE